MKLTLTIPTPWMKPVIESIIEQPLLDTFESEPLTLEVNWRAKDMMGYVKALVVAFTNLPMMATNFKAATELFEDEGVDETSVFTTPYPDIEDGDETELDAA